MSRVELKPCPFCGSDDIEISNTHTPAFSVECQACHGSAEGEYFESPKLRADRFSYVGDRESLNECEATYDGLHPEYRAAFDSAVAAWNRRAA